MSVEAGRHYMENFRIPVKQPDPNRVPGYINPKTIEVQQIGPVKVSVFGGPNNIDINI